MDASFELERTPGARERIGLVTVAILLCAAALLGLARIAISAGIPATALASSCPPSKTPDAHDYSGLVLTMCNFSSQDLSNANFSNATLTAALFVRTNLTQANFNGAIFANSGNPAFPNDFTSANLTQATFDKAQFNGLTYLSYAQLDCAGFTNTDISNGNAVFGDAPLRLAADLSACRTSFAKTLVNCEFVPQWKALDMSGVTNLGACSAQLAKADFSRGVFVGAVFDRINLANTNWAGANLTQASFQGATLDGATGLHGEPMQVAQLTAAKFNNASIRGVDFSAAQLYGAVFSGANLDGSSFHAAQLGEDPTQQQYVAARFDYAWLRNVDFSQAQLESVNFTFASIYGTYYSTAPKSQCTVTPAKCGGKATCSCASMASANLNSAKFGNAFLYGVDFTGAIIKGTSFGNAVLVAANFATAQFGTFNGEVTDFTGAWLQGSNFDSTAALDNVSMQNAFVDFGADDNQQTGNQIVVKLTSDYTNFNGRAPGTPCVKLRYSAFSVTPTGIATMICPDGFSYQNGCGANLAAPDQPTSIAPNPHWASANKVGTNSGVVGFYVNTATYDAAAISPTAQCPGGAIDKTWVDLTTPALAGASSPASTSTTTTTR